MSVAGTVGTVTGDRIQFQSNVTPAPVGHYTEGRVTWTSGPNNGLISDIQLYTTLNGVILLHLQTPYPILAGHTFTIIPGCGRTEPECVAYANKINFGGYEDLPGNDQLFDTPTAKTS